MHADIPWTLLVMAAICAPAECDALLKPSGGSSGQASHLTGLLHKALEHAAGMLHQTAVSDKYVSTSACMINRCSMPAARRAPIAWWHARLGLAEMSSQLPLVSRDVLALHLVSCNSAS
jgi:hypothetical protein